VDVTTCVPDPVPPRYDLGYMGRYGADRQHRLTHLMLLPARRWRAGRFAVVGPYYPPSLRWPANVRHIEHLSPASCRAFYNSQRYTLNIAHSATP